MKYAQVIEGVVVNVILWDGEAELVLDGDLINVDDQPVGPGWMYTDGVFVAPPEPDADDEFGEPDAAV